jgi:non-homologous end joining protein Ku
MKLPPEMMKLAQRIIRTKSDDFDQTMLEDHYRSALARILRKKQAKRPRGQAVTRERGQPHGLRSVVAEPHAKPTGGRGAPKTAAGRRGGGHRRAG